MRWIFSFTADYVPVLFHWLSASYIHPRSDEKEVAADSISAQPVEVDVISSKQGSVKYEKVC